MFPYIFLQLSFHLSRFKGSDDMKIFVWEKLHA